jgi:hypothetical protein
VDATAVLAHVAGAGVAWLHVRSRLRQRVRRFRGPGRQTITIRPLRSTHTSSAPFTITSEKRANSPSRGGVVRNGR